MAAQHSRNVAPRSRSRPIEAPWLRSGRRAKVARRRCVPPSSPASTRSRRVTASPSKTTSSAARSPSPTTAPSAPAPRSAVAAPRSKARASPSSPRPAPRGSRPPSACSSAAASRSRSRRSTPPSELAWFGDDAGADALIVSADLAAIGPDATALLLYTSGTTGKPKGARITHDNLAVQAALLREAWGYREGDRLLHALPLHHLHGLGISLLTTLLAGSAARLLPRFDAVRVWNESPSAPPTAPPASSAAPRSISSRAAATSSAPWKSKKPCATTPLWPRSPSSAYPTRSGVIASSPSSSLRLAARPRAPPRPSAPGPGIAWPRTRSRARRSSSRPCLVTPWARSSSRS